MCDYLCVLHVPGIPVSSLVVILQPWCTGLNKSSFASRASALTAGNPSQVGNTRLYHL